MKKILAALFLASSVSSWAKPPEVLKFPDLQFTPPKVSRIVLENGTTVFFLPDHELPLINLSAMIRTGSIYEPSDKTGLAGLTGTMIRGGGTLSRKREDLDAELEFTGASVETGIGLENGSASLSCLTKDFDKTLAIFTDVLLHPDFDPKKLEIEKAKMIETVRRRNDEPFQIARRQYRKAIYGPTHALSRTEEIPEIRKIRREDLIDFYRNFFRPQNMMIAVSGDFEIPEMTAKLRRAFSGWSRGATVWPKVEKIAVKPTPKERTVVYAQKDLNQTSLILGELGVARHNPDHFSLEVMNEILGGQTFTSRLYQTIRTKEGLAYWVGSSFSEPYDRGTIAGASQTRSNAVGRTIRLMLEEIERIIREPVSAEELDFAKDSIKNSFVFRYNSAHAVVSEVMSLEYFGFPKDYLETYTQKISAVTIADVQAAAKKYLRPSEMTLVVVGNQKDFDVPLSTFGKVVPADISIKE